MNPIYFFWALFARSGLRNLLPDYDQWNSVGWISHHYAGLVQLKISASMPFVLRLPQGKVDHIKNRVRLKSKGSLS